MTEDMEDEVLRDDIHEWVDANMLYLVENPIHADRLCENVFDIYSHDVRELEVYHSDMVRDIVYNIVAKYAAKDKLNVSEDDVVSKA